MTPRRRGVGTALDLAVLAIRWTAVAIIVAVWILVALIVRR